MSRRTRTSGCDNADELRKGLANLKEAAAKSDAEIISATPSSEFDQLSPVEQSAASLGVNPDSWKPISFLNNAHYAQLTAANMLDDNLARRIEAYRFVASPDGVSA